MTWPHAPLRADIIVIQNPPREVAIILQNLKRGHPGLTEEELRARANPGGVILTELKQKLPPEGTVQAVIGTFFQGKIRQYEFGPRTGSYFDPLNYDWVRFVVCLPSIPSAAETLEIPPTAGYLRRHG